MLKRNDIESAFRKLAGKQLSIARRAGSGRNFHFGEVREYPADNLGRARTGGEFALHLGSPWRIEGPNGMVNGSEDIWHHAEQEAPPAGWTYEQGSSLQDQRPSELLGG